MTHFFLSPRNSRSVAVACAPDNPAAYTLIPKLANKNRIPFDLTLKNVSFTNKGIIESDDLSGLKHSWFDYQPNSLAWPIMSERLRDIIDSHASGEELHEWLPVTINSENESRTYFTLRFKE